jgi:hypothetical protein
MGGGGKGESSSIYPACGGAHSGHSGKGVRPSEPCRLSEPCDMWKLGGSHDDLAGLWASCGGDLFNDDEMPALDELLFNCDGCDGDDTLGLDLQATPHHHHHHPHHHHHHHHHTGGGQAVQPTHHHATFGEASNNGEPGMCVAPITAA